MSVNKALLLSKHDRYRFVGYRGCGKRHDRSAGAGQHLLSLPDMQTDHAGLVGYLNWGISQQAIESVATASDDNGNLL